MKKTIFVNAENLETIDLFEETVDFDFEDGYTLERDDDRCIYLVYGNKRARISEPKATFFSVKTAYNLNYTKRGVNNLVNGVTRLSNASRYEISDLGISTSTKKITKKALNDLLNTYKLATGCDYALDTEMSVANQYAELSNAIQCIVNTCKSASVLRVVMWCNEHDVKYEANSIKGIRVYKDDAVLFDCWSRSYGLRVNYDCCDEIEDAEIVKKTLNVSSSAKKYPNTIYITTESFINVLNAIDFNSEVGE